MGGRDEVLAEVARAVAAVSRPHPVRVAIDGNSAAGKSTFGDELAAAVRAVTSRPVIRVGLDWFKRAVSLRTAYPQDSPDSYYLDSWDYPAIREQLLEPLGPGGGRRYRDAIMNLPATEPVDGPVRTAADDAILLADGAFLQRAELDAYWDLRIYLAIGFDEVLRRGIVRDQAWMGDAAAAEHRYRTKYIPGEQRYVDEVRPHERADLVVDNTDFAAPLLVRGDPALRCANLQVPVMPAIERYTRSYRSAA
ncbi:uridylate kinase [Catellatospora sp. KI3]|uniref:uridylate kinase n=1 Tax=Catellatospora sp. KI3 TaxID=3041620 RepID=UPI0024821D0E|nr:uridylate kinase [Catellatospora sp. KI3]MDI1463327.1 uridylate kinase [Catellatospora sp. KI3]